MSEIKPEPKIEIPTQSNNFITALENPIVDSCIIPEDDIPTYEKTTWAAKGAYLHPFDNTIFKIFDAKGDGYCGFYAYMYLLYRINSENQKDKVRSITEAFKDDKLLYKLIENINPEIDITNSDKRIAFPTEDVNQFKKTILMFITGEESENSYSNIWKKDGDNKLPEAQYIFIKTMCEKLKEIYNILTEITANDSIPPMNVYVNTDDDVRNGSPIKFTIPPASDTFTPLNGLAEKIDNLNELSQAAYNALENSSVMSPGASEQYFKHTDARAIYIAFKQLICGVNLDENVPDNTTIPVEERKGQFSTDIMITLYRITNIPVFTVSCSLYNDLKGKWLAQVDNECFPIPPGSNGFGYPISIKYNAVAKMHMVAEMPPILLANIGGGHFQCVIPVSSIQIEKKDGKKGPYILFKNEGPEVQTDKLTLQSRLMNVLRDMNVPGDISKIAEEARKRTSTLEGALNFIFPDVQELSESKLKSEKVTESGEKWELPEDLRVNQQLIDRQIADETARGRTKIPGPQQQQERVKRHSENLDKADEKIPDIFKTPSQPLPRNNTNSKDFYISYIDTIPKGYIPTCKDKLNSGEYADRFYNVIKTKKITITKDESATTSIGPLKNKINLLHKAFEKFRDLQITGISISEIETWLSATSTGKYNEDTANINHFNTPEEIEFYKKLNPNLHNQWLGSTPAPSFNHFSGDPLKEKQKTDVTKIQGGFTMLLMNELVPPKTNEWWDADKKEIIVYFKDSQGDRQASLTKNMKKVISNKSLTKTERIPVHITPKIVSVCATNTDYFRITGDIDKLQLYNLKTNGINILDAINATQLVDIYTYAYRQQKLNDAFNNRLNVDYFMNAIKDTKNLSGIDEAQRQKLTVARQTILPIHHAIDDDDDDDDDSDEEKETPKITPQLNTQNFAKLENILNDLIRKCTNEKNKAAKKGSRISACNDFKTTIKDIVATSMQPEPSVWREIDYIPIPKSISNEFLNTPLYEKDTVIVKIEQRRYADIQLETQDAMSRVKKADTDLEKFNNYDKVIQLTIKFTTLTSSKTINLLQMSESVKDILSIENTWLDDTLKLLNNTWTNETPESITDEYVKAKVRAEGFRQFARASFDASNSVLMNNIANTKKKLDSQVDKCINAIKEDIKKLGWEDTINREAAQKAYEDAIKIVKLGNFSDSLYESTINDDGFYELHSGFAGGNEDPERQPIFPYINVKTDLGTDSDNRITISGAIVIQEYLQRLTKETYNLSKNEEEKDWEQISEEKKRKLLQETKMNLGKLNYSGNIRKPEFMMAESQNDFNEWQRCAKDWKPIGDDTKRIEWDATPEYFERTSKKVGVPDDCGDLYTLWSKVKVMEANNTFNKIASLMYDKNIIIIKKALGKKTDDTLKKEDIVEWDNLTEANKQQVIAMIVNQNTYDFDIRTKNDVLKQFQGELRQKLKYKNSGILGVIAKGVIFGIGKGIIWNSLRPLTLTKSLADRAKNKWNQISEENRKSVKIITAGTSAAVLSITKFSAATATLLSGIGFGGGAIMAALIIGAALTGSPLDLRDAATRDFYGSKIKKIISTFTTSPEYKEVQKMTSEYINLANKQASALKIFGDIPDCTKNLYEILSKWLEKYIELTTLFVEVQEKKIPSTMWTVKTDDINAYSALSDGKNSSSSQLNNKPSFIINITDPQQNAVSGIISAVISNDGKIYDDSGMANDKTGYISGLNTNFVDPTSETDGLYKYSVFNITGFFEEQRGRMKIPFGEDKDKAVDVIIDKIEPLTEDNPLSESKTKTGPGFITLRVIET